MLEEKMEIVLITFNRDKYLEKTLEQLLESPFKNCKITILDNCSTDNTSGVCKKYEKLFNNLSIIRHKQNIGGNPNILRAIETSNSLYTWILCDDDKLDFSDCDDMINAINSEKFDIIINYSLDFKNKEGKSINDILNSENKKSSRHNNINKKYDFNENLQTSGKELFNILEQYYYSIMTFIPASIFKTEIYDSECFIEGYDNVHNMYPHYKYISKSIEEDLKIYKTEKDIIVRGEETGSTYSVLKWLISWLDSSLIIKDKHVRNIVTSKYYNNYSLVHMAIYSIIQGKAQKDENLKNQTIALISSIYKIKGLVKGFLYSILIVLLMLIPRAVAKVMNHKIESVKEELKEEIEKNRVI
ncbi:MAG: glycosyltransferase family 2 protein [Methanobacteriaceae archaeon]